MALPGAQEFATHCKEEALPSASTAQALIDVHGEAVKLQSLKELVDSAAAARRDAVGSAEVLVVRHQ